MSDYNYPAELIKKTKVRIQKQLDGNGVEPKAVKLDVTKQGLGVISGETRFALDCHVQANVVKGRSVKGEVVETGQSKTKIDGFLDDFHSKDGFATMAKDLIKKMPLHGFGVDKQDISLKSETLTVTEQIHCNRCNGQGQSQCGHCGGRCQMVCPLCHGHGLMNCMNCQGRGQINVGGSMQPCSTCQSRGQVFCTQCHGQKQIQCHSCNGRGKSSCNECAGQGVNSLHMTAVPILKITSDIFIADLDAEPKNFISKIGAMKMAVSGHIAPKTVDKIDDEEVDRAYYEKTPEDKSRNRIYYEADVPWCVMHMSFAQKPYKIGMIGKKGAIAQSDNFMDEILRKPFDLVKRAASGDGYIAGLLKDASSFRISRETLSMIMRMGPKKTMNGLLQNYSIGLSKDMIQSFVKQSYAAMKRVTRRPRYIGLMIGLLMSASMSYLWWMDGLREMTQMHPIHIRYGIDGGMGVVMMIITMIMIKVAGFIPYKKVMDHIGIKVNKMPAMGTAGFYAIIGNIAIWAGAYLYLLLG